LASQAVKKLADYIDDYQSKEVAMSTGQAEAERIHHAVATVYGELARSEKPKQCCAVDFPVSPDYSAEELASVPPGAYLGAGSGNPVRHAALRPGETVVDLGSGAGIDSFLAANRVGPIGRVYGFDLTPEMVARARQNAAEKYSNVSFDRSEIEHLPLESETADVAISNCVINLSPDKNKVFSEIFRVLRPGGRISISDIVLRGDAEAVETQRHNPELEKWCACVLGALRQDEYLAAIRAAGFVDVTLVSERPARSQPGGDVAAVAITLTARRPQ
jgi:SAM-dependent methyltransferase